MIGAVRFHQADPSKGAPKPWTAETIDEAVEYALQRTRDVFERDGKVYLNAHLLATRQPDGTEQDCFCMFPCLGLSKDEWQRELRAAAKAVRAKAVITIMECWHVMGDAAIRVADRYPSLENHPDAVEAIRLAVERRDRAAYRFYAAITRAPDGRASLGPWERVDGGTSTGRLTGFVEAGS